VLPTPGMNFQSVRAKYSGSKRKNGTICKLRLLGEAQLSSKKRVFQNKSQFFSIKSCAAFEEREYHSSETFHLGKIQNWPHPPDHLRLL
jgi:hypothetical protein